MDECRDGGVVDEEFVGEDEFVFVVGEEVLVEDVVEVFGDVGVDL